MTAKHPTTAAPSVAAAYGAGDLPEFFRLSPGDLKAALATTREVDRAALVRALRAYHRDLGTLGAPLEAQLEKLAHPNSRAVVTGQQAGLLTGPAYSVHKGADAVLLARALDADERPVLPIYWVASQDHDAAEVASTTLLDLRETLHHVRLDLPRGVPIGRIAWREEWTREVEKVLASFDAPAVHKDAVRALLRPALREGSYADVFARLMHGLLGTHGLIVLDPLHPALAALFAPALARELQGPLESSRRIEEGARALEARGFAPQLHRPEGASNLFLEGDDGQRRLLRWDGRAFQADRRYDRAELLDVLAREPGRLTPAAGLRPILQDRVLPTAAFVVGPGEIAYGAQLRGVYELHGLPQPLLWPRLSVTWLEPPVARILGRFGLSAKQFQASPDATLGEALLKIKDAHGAVSARISELQAGFEALSAEISALDPTLARPARRTNAKTLERVARLRGQAVRALLQAEDTRTGQVSRLRLHLLPRGTPQEREMNFLTYLLKHGAVPLERLLGLPPGWNGEMTL